MPASSTSGKHVLCFSHLETVTDSTVFCVLAEIMYLGSLSDILNIFFFHSSHTEHILLVKFLLCGRPAQLHSHAGTPRCGLMGLFLSHCFNSQTFVAEGCSPNILARQPQWAFVHLFIYLFICLVGFSFGIFLFCFTLFFCFVFSFSSRVN